MIRPLQSTDLPDLLALLQWMDDAPEREVFAPEARDLSELALECEDSHGFVDVDDEGVVQAYGAVTPFRDGMVLEGPLGQGALAGLLGRALPLAEGLPVYAFCARDNQPVRAVLEGAGFAPMHTTDFYQAPLSRLSEAARLPGREYRILHHVPLSEYRALFRDSEDAWAGRLHWTPEQYDAHFARDDVRLVALRHAAPGQPERLLGFAELEYHPDDARADLSYLAVHPAERGSGYGRLLVALAAAEAETRPELRQMLVRAHDHMSAARQLYAREGFTHCRSVVTYLLPGDEEV